MAKNVSHLLEIEKNKRYLHWGLTKLSGSFKKTSVHNDVAVAETVLSIFERGLVCDGHSADSQPDRKVGQPTRNSRQNKKAFAVKGNKRGRIISCRCGRGAQETHKPLKHILL